MSTWQRKTTVKSEIPHLPTGLAELIFEYKELTFLIPILFHAKKYDDIALLCLNYLNNAVSNTVPLALERLTDEEQAIVLDHWKEKKDDTFHWLRWYFLNGSHPEFRYLTPVLSHPPPTVPPALFHSVALKVEAANAFLQCQERIRKPMLHINLKGAVLKNLNLTNVNLSYANLSGVTFSGLFIRTNLMGALLQGGNFIGSYIDTDMELTPEQKLILQQGITFAHTVYQPCIQFLTMKKSPFTWIRIFEMPAATFEEYCCAIYLMGSKNCKELKERMELIKIRLNKTSDTFKKSLEELIASDFNLADCL